MATMNMNSIVCDVTFRHTMSDVHRDSKYFKLVGGQRTPIKISARLRTHCSSSISTLNMPLFVHVEFERHVITMNSSAEARVLQITENAESSRDWGGTVTSAVSEAVPRAALQHAHVPPNETTGGSW